jgi:hypothetical protein
MVLDPDYGPQLELRRHQGGISPSTPPRPKPQVQSVPPILRRQRQNSMPGYSKGAQGLSVYVRVTGIFTGATDSPSALRRQCPNRYAIRAGRNLPDKEFRLILLLHDRGDRPFLPISACRHAVRTFSSIQSRLNQIAWRKVSEDSASTDAAFPADHLHSLHCHCHQQGGE